MRVLMWFTVGFAAACGLLAYARNQLWLLLAGAALLVLTLAVLAALRKPVLLRHGILILTGCVAGLLWYGAWDWLYLQPMYSLEDTMELTITVTDYSHDTGYGAALDGRTRLAGRSYPLRIYLTEPLGLEPGDTIRGTFEIRVIRTQTEKYDAYYQAKGVFLTAYGGADLCRESSQIPLWCFPAVLRYRLLRLMETLFPADTAPFAKALLLGERRDLDYETTSALEHSGILHIVAVSGLHVSLLYVVISWVTFRQRILTALLGMPFLLLFAAVADFTPSVMRAVIMAWMMILADLLEQPYDSATALSFSVLAMLLANPMAVTSVSLQLSVGCVMGILLFSAPIREWLRHKLPDTRAATILCSSTSVTISAVSLITPLSAVYFGSVSLISVVTNLLTLWVTNGVFNGIILTCFAWLLHPPLAQLLASLLSWPIRYVLAVADFLASLPLAAVYTVSGFIVGWLAVVYVLFALFLLLGRKAPGHFLSLGTLGLCAALLLSWNQEAVITMLDVGQGQSILLQAEGKTFLVDCGGSSDADAADLAAETLLSRGITRLDAVIVTHYDRDHAGGIHNLLTRIDTDLLILPDTRTDWTPPETSGEILYVWEDIQLSAGTAGLRIYGPVYTGASNENSLCVLFDTEKCDILITGDRTGFGERMLLRRTDLPDVDILVAGHHADREAVTEELLQKVKPETVLISAGKNNFYGHPSALVLKRLEAFGCTVYRTDRDGTITIRR